MNLKAQFLAARRHDIAITTAVELVPYPEQIRGSSHVVAPVSWREEFVHWGPHAHQCYLRNSTEAIEAERNALAAIRFPNPYPRATPSIGSCFD